MRVRRIELEFENREEIKSSYKNRKIIDSNIECFSKYLNENNLIDVTEAKNRAHEKTGLEVGITCVRGTLVNLSEEIVLEYTKLRSSNSVPKYRKRAQSVTYKLKDSHIECFKKYLKENAIIDNEDAWSQFCNESGLEVSISTVRRALIKLREQINLEQAQHLYLPQILMLKLDCGTMTSN